MSLGIIVTRLAWIAHKLVSSNRPTRYASAASCNASTAWLWKRRSVCNKNQNHQKHPKLLSKPIMKTKAQILITATTHYLEVLSNFTNQPLEGELPDQELSTLLILPNLTVQNKNSYNKLLETEPNTITSNKNRTHWIITQYNLLNITQKKISTETHRRATVPGR